MNDDNIEDDLCRKFNICGCGQPDKALELILEVLTLIYRRSTIKTLEYEQYDRELKALLPDDRVRYCMLYFIDSSGVIEHGGSVGGSWIDWGDGEKWFRKLQQYFGAPQNCMHCFDKNDNIDDGCCIKCGFHAEYLKQEYGKD